MDDERLWSMRPVSIRSIRADLVIRSSAAISLSPSQNDFSSETLVLFPASIIERLATGEAGLRRFLSRRTVPESLVSIKLVPSGCHEQISKVWLVHPTICQQEAVYYWTVVQLASKMLNDVRFTVERQHRNCLLSASGHTRHLAMREPCPLW